MMKSREGGRAGGRESGNFRGGMLFCNEAFSSLRRKIVEEQVVAEAVLPERYRPLLVQARRADPVLAGRKVLIVDDDMRNVFALMHALEQCGINVLNAADGKECLDILQGAPEIDIVLMDIMMPGIDGYETIRIIRGYEQFKQLPIIALTARAMKGDREKCIEAGASDYIAKPVDVQQLTALLRGWVHG